MSDLRYALRALRKNPGFASVAIVSLALGIGATVAIYSVIRAVLLEPLPVAAPEELFAAGWKSGAVRPRGILSLGSTSYQDERGGANYSSNFSYSLYRAFRESAGAPLFAFSYAATDVAVSFAGEPLAASSLMVSDNFFSTLGVRTILGRPLGEKDNTADATPAAVLTYAFWIRAFGGDPSVVERTIQLNATPFTIVGVTGPGFYGMSKGGPFFKPTDIVLPLIVEPLVYTRGTPRALFGADDRWWLHVMARVKPEAAPHLEAALNSTFRGVLGGSSIPALREASTGELRLFRAPNGLDSWTRGLRQPLVILAIVVGVVLLIACVNVGTLMIVRGVARQRELSIRLALGSSRWQIVRGQLAESAVVTVAGGLLAIVVAVWGARALIRTIVDQSVTTSLDIAIDRRLFGAAAIVSVFGGLLFSVVPAFRAARGDIVAALKNGGGRSALPRVTAGPILMVAQVAISVPLLVGASLFLRTVYNLSRVDLGFDPARLLLFRIDPSLNGYDADRIERLYGRLLERLEAAPGVQSATLTDIVLISRLQNNWTFQVPGSEPKNVKFARVGAAYFDTFGIPIVAGRAIGVQDHSHAPRVAVVNETAARTLFGSQAAIGRQVAMQSDQPAEFEIVGIVKDSRYTSPRDPMPPTVYLPFAQTTLGRLGAMNVVIRSTMPAAALGTLVRTAMADVDRNVPITNLRTQVSQIEEATGTERAFMRLLVAFGAFALLLASLGLHGVTAYSVARRTGEIGVRMALGARQLDVLRLVFRQVMAITMIGLGIGVPLAVALSRFVRALLYGVDPIDPASLIASILVMAAVAVLAGFFPAWRAARLNPLAALRSD